MSRWPTMPLGNVADIVRGVSFDKSEVVDSPSPGYLPILRAGNIGSTLDTVDDLVWVPEYKVSDSQKMKLHDVAICMSSGSPDIVGKTAQLENEWQGSVGAFCAIIRFRDVNPRFGAYWLRGPDFRAWRDSQAKGANIQNLRKTELETLDLPVPPLAEQERIAQILDEAESLRRLRATTDQRTESLVSSLFYTTIREGEQGDCPFISMGQLLRVKSGESLTAEGMDPLGTYPVYGGNGINGYHSAFMFDKPVVVIGRVGVYCGAVHLTQQESWVTDNALYVAETYRDMDIVFLAEALREARLNQYAGQAAQPLVSAGRIYPVPIPVPHIERQHAFAVQVREIRELEALQASSRKRLDDLFDALLHRALRGEI